MKRAIIAFICDYGVVFLWCGFVVVAFYFFAGCAGTIGNVFGPPIPGSEKGAVVCAKGTGIALGPWSSVLLAEQAKTEGFTFTVDENCNIRYGPLK